MRLEVQLDTKADVVPVALVLQSLNVLALNAEDLRKSVQEFVNSNPLVDYAPVSGAGFDPESVPFNSGNESGSLADYLEFQLRMMTKDEDLLRIGTIIAGSLDRDGYLRENRNDLASICKCSASRFNEALDLVRSCDPAGVAAVDLQECLSIQLKAMDDPAVPLALEIVRDHLQEMAYGTVMISGRSQEEIEDAGRLIRGLNPRPGSGYETEVINYILPDVLIEDDENGGLQVSLINQPPCPVLNEYYRDYLKTEDEADREYIKADLAKARSFIYSIKRREQTIFSIVNLAVHLQTEYIMTGDRSRLIPFTMAACAKHTDRSVSTVSRCISGKYAVYNGKLIPIRALFTSGGVGTSSREHIVERIREITGADPHISDKKTAEILAAEGIEISRRTVNKYRNLYLGKNAEE